MDYYKKEVQENEAKLNTMKEEKRDPYDIKKFEEVLGESYMMIPDSEARLKKSLEELAQFIDSDEYQNANNNNNNNKSEWIETTRNILKEHLSGGKSLDNNKNLEESYDGNCEVQETNVGELKDDEAF